ncbi:hypothetical protein OROGR_015273 [Orobanche gracilis]
MRRKTEEDMAKTKPGKKDLDSYNIKGTNKVVRRPSRSFRWSCANFQTI